MNAYDLRDLSSEIVLSGLSIDKPGETDYFQFTTLSTGVPGQYIELDTNSSAGGLDMQIQAAGGQVVTANGNSLKTTNAIDSEQLSLDRLPAGTYWLEISGVTTAVTNPEYSLTFLPPQTPTPDYAEPNNVSSEAYDLGNASAAGMTTGGEVHRSGSGSGGGGSVFGDDNPSVYSGGGSTCPAPHIPNSIWESAQEECLSSFHNKSNRAITHRLADFFARAAIVAACRPLTAQQQEQDQYRSQQAEAEAQRYEANAL